MVTPKLTNRASDFLHDKNNVVISLFGAIRFFPLGPGGKNGEGGTGGRASAVHTLSRARPVALRWNPLKLAIVKKTNPDIWLMTIK